MAHSSFHTASFYTQKLLDTEAFTHTHKLLHTASSHTEKLLHTEAYTDRNFYTQKLLQAFMHRVFTQELFHTANIFHTASFCTEKLVNINFYTEKFLHREAFAHRTVHTEKLSCTQWQQKLQLQTGARRQSEKKRI